MILSFATSNANRHLIRLVGAAPAKKKKTSLTVACISRSAGNRNTDLLPCGFRKIQKSQIQQELFEEDQYTYRIFCTNLNEKAHQVIDIYDKRADAENLIGEAKQEGLDAIPSSKFKNNYAFFQIAMLAYNLWRYFKIMANLCGVKVKMFAGISDNKIRIARLKLLMVGAKIVKSGNREHREIFKSRYQDASFAHVLWIYGSSAI
jgi:hypothetical protein